MKFEFKHYYNRFYLELGFTLCHPKEDDWFKNHWSLVIRFLGHEFYFSIHKKEDY